MKKKLKKSFEEKILKKNFQKNDSENIFPQKKFKQEFQQQVKKNSPAKIRKNVTHRHFTIIYRSSSLSSLSYLLSFTSRSLITITIWSCSVQDQSLKSHFPQYWQKKQSHEWDLSSNLFPALSDGVWLRRPNKNWGTPVTWDLSWSRREGRGTNEKQMMMLAIKMMMNVK